MYMSNPCSLFPLYNTDLCWVLTFFSALNGKGEEGEMYSHIRNSSQVPALIKPREAHYWGCEGCFCPYFTLFCQGIASRNMQSVQSSCSTPVIGVNWGCSNSSTSAFLLHSVGFSSPASAANPARGHWAHWVWCDACGVFKNQIGCWARGGRFLPKDPLGVIASCDEMVMREVVAFRHFSSQSSPTLKWMLLFYISEFSALGCGTENQQCSCLLVSARSVPFLLPLVKNSCRKVVSGGGKKGCVRISARNNHSIQGAEGTISVTHSSLSTWQRGSIFLCFLSRSLTSPCPVLMLHSGSLVVSFLVISLPVLGRGDFFFLSIWALFAVMVYAKLCVPIVSHLLCYSCPPEHS